MIKVLLLLVLVLGGCRSCSPQTDKTHKVPAQAESAFHVNSKKLFMRYQRFSFSSELNFSLLADMKKQVFSESVSLDGVDGLFRFSKKIDAAHYLEIISDGSHYVVKNRQNPWRDGDDNKDFLAEVVDDGLNLSNWLLDQCGVTGSAQIESFVSPESAFIKSMPIEAKLHSCKLVGNINADNSELELSCEAQGGSLKLSARTKLLENKDLAEIVMPQVSGDEPLLYPVNIRPKLIDVLKQETR